MSSMAKGVARLIVYNEPMGVMMKSLSVISMLLICSSLMQIQSAYAVMNPKDPHKLLLKKTGKSEKKQEKQNANQKQNQSASAEKTAAFENQSSQTGQPRFEPYSYP